MMSTASEIARFLIEEHKPSIQLALSDMSDEEVGLSIATAVSERFPDHAPDDLLQALLIAQEVERSDLSFNRAGTA